MIKNDSQHKQIEQLNDYIQHLLAEAKEKEIDLSNISLLDIIERFLAYMLQVQPVSVDLDIVADLLVSISTLIFFKSNLLLPVQLEEEDEDIQEYDIDDATQEEYWKEYKKYQNLIKLFQEKAQVQNTIHLTNLKSPTNRKEVYQENHFSSLIIALESILAKSKTRKPINLNKRKYNLIEKMREIENKLQQNQGQLTFESFVTPDCPKIEIIIVFMALLELICRRKVSYQQSKNFGELTFYRKEEKKLKKQKIHP